MSNGYATERNHQRFEREKRLAEVNKALLEAVRSIMRPLAEGASVTDEEYEALEAAIALAEKETR